MKVFYIITSLLFVIFSGNLTVSNNISSNITLKKNPCQNCGITKLSEGSIPSLNGFQLEKPVMFDDGVGIHSGKCFPLYAKGKLITWLDSYHQVGTKIYLRRCIEVNSITDIASGSKGGMVEDDFYEFRLIDKDRDPEFIKLLAPLWSEFANPSFCNSYISYWGTEWEENGSAKVFAIIFDLTNLQVVKKEFLGKMQIESDSRAFFSSPKWSESEIQVVFPIGRQKKLLTGNKVGLDKFTLSVK